MFLHKDNISKEIALLVSSINSFLGVDSQVPTSSKAVLCGQHISVLETEKDRSFDPKSLFSFESFGDLPWVNSTIIGLSRGC